MTKLVLKPDFSLRMVKAAHAELSRVLASGESIAIDGSAVAQADVAGVQLLVSATVTAQRAGCPLSITAMSQTLASAVSRAGLTLSACGQRFETKDA